MSDFVLTLGGVEFREFEVPESIRAGGHQALETHKYPGGRRTVDTSGPDDGAIAWSGFFEDDDAELRCQQIDTMRRQGLPALLTWSSYGYAVVIESFEWDFRRFYHIGYSISLAVVQDETQPAGEAVPDVEGQIQTDLGSALSNAQGFVAGVESGLSAAVGAVQRTIGAVNSITGGSISFLSNLQQQIGGAASIARGVLDYTDTALARAGAAVNFISGTAPLMMIANVNALTEQASAIPLAFDSVVSLTRAQDNVVALSGSDLANQLDSNRGSFISGGVTYGPLIAGPNG